jgi:hypothetical protein
MNKLYKTRGVMTQHCKSCRQDLDESKYENSKKTCTECLLKGITKRKNIKRAGVNQFKIITLEICQDKAKSKNGICLSTEYINSKTKLIWQCSKGHKWDAVWSSIKAGYWCNECGGRKTLTIKECKAFAEKKNGKCLSTTYKNAYQKLLWQCSKSHEWIADFHHIKHSNRWCPDCSRFKTEAVCRSIIEDFLLEKFPTKRPKFLEGLELDGYNEDLKMAFEYNGKQHYEYIPFFHGNDPKKFESQKLRDIKKYNICFDKGISLILIPYQYSYEKPDELRDFIYIELCKIT